jgi:hypothetical protein
MAAPAESTEAPEYPYHHSDYHDIATGEIVSLPCKHCRPGQPCASFRGTFDRFPGSDASMFVQWKGTEVCLDFHCECGYSGHIDDSFAYYVECGGCGAVYEMGTQVKARKLGDDEDPDGHEPKVALDI